MNELQAIDAGWIVALPEPDEGDYAPEEEIALLTERVDDLERRLAGLTDGVRDRMDALEAACRGRGGQQIGGVSMRLTDGLVEAFEIDLRDVMWGLTAEHLGMSMGARIDADIAAMAVPFSSRGNGWLRGSGDVGLLIA